jgi:hypothetical protein
MGMITALIFICVLGIAVGGGFYLYGRLRAGDSSRMFAPRIRRLACIERTSLDGGRKLLLVRRDDVEHLILIGGPMDLVIETGLRPEGPAGVAAKEGGHASAAGPYLPASGARQQRDSSFSDDKSANPVEPRLSLSPKANAIEGDTLELTTLQEAKAAR